MSSRVVHDRRHLVVIEADRQVVILDDLHEGCHVLRIHANETGPCALDYEQAVLDPAGRQALAGALLGVDLEELFRAGQQLALAAEQHWDDGPLNEALAAWASACPVDSSTGEGRR